MIDKKDAIQDRGAPRCLTFNPIRVCANCVNWSEVLNPVFNGSMAVAMGYLPIGTCGLNDHSTAVSHNANCSRWSKL